MARKPSVLFLVEGDATNPVPFYRGHLPARALRLRGWQAFATGEGIVWPNGMFGSAALDGPTDICVLRRPVNDDGDTHDLTGRIRAARDAGQRIYADLDDDYWHLPPTNPARGLMTAENLDRWQANIDATDGLICSTPGLAASMSGHTAVPIHVCPNGIDPALYTPKEGEYQPLRVGWLGPWRWRNDDMASIADWLTPILNDRADRVEFVHLGITPTDEGRIEDVLPDLKTRIRKVPWVPFPCLEQSLKQVDVLVVPQRLGGEFEPFANSRSPTSAIAAIASGVVVWATPIDSYRRFFGEALPDSLPDLLDHKDVRRRYRRLQRRLLDKVNLYETSKPYERVFL